MKTSIQGFPRVGKSRELKFKTESWFRKEIPDSGLLETARTLRKTHRETLQAEGIDLIPSNDFSFFDNMLDTAILLNVIPQRYRVLELSPLETLFAMARGYQGEKGDVKALALKKWFNTNYHYLESEIEIDTHITVAGEKPFSEYAEARELGIETKPVIIGPVTFLKLARYTGDKKCADYAGDIAAAYAGILRRFDALGAQWVELDEPFLVTDLSGEDRALFREIYGNLLESKGTVRVLLQTYFGDIRDVYSDVVSLPFDAIGLDFVEGKKNFDLVSEYGFPSGTFLVAGLVNGKNIWRNEYQKTLESLDALKKYCAMIYIGSSCSLLHVPYAVSQETELSAELATRLAFAEEKLGELRELSFLFAIDDPDERYAHPFLVQNRKRLAGCRTARNEELHDKIASLGETDWTRKPAFADRARIQKERFALPLYPTTTIGSFPQTGEVTHNRARYKKGEIDEEEYSANVRKMIASCIALQEELGLDVLVHGEFERNDMVEYFGEQLAGFAFTRHGWVQSYGTRCVRPPVIAGDIFRKKPFTVKWATYAQSLTDKPVKGMLTGPITILNWSFPREDIVLKESAFQIALAIREEVLDLEKNGISIIQIDEAALKEKLPLRKSDWHAEYLDWAKRAFNLVHSGVKSDTQIHTHMCYSEFTDIIAEIDALDADVISFEASRSGFSILDALARNHFRTAVGPGVYDIHSTRIPPVGELVGALAAIRKKIPVAQIWVNPDCGLKTRGLEETKESLANMVEAARRIRIDEISCR
jgi:5-methyltetrahydropteroyltriglutamate--homocysteine methyltransferase